MGERLLIRRAPRRRADQRGFTLLEVMSAMLIGAVALTANLTMFSYAAKDFKNGRCLTDATNFATNTFAVLKTRTVAQIVATTDNVAAGLVVGTHADAAGIPGSAFDPSDLTRCQVINGTMFCRTWTVANVDVDGDATADEVGNLVKVRIIVSWQANEGAHQITMATMTTGRPL